MKKAPGKLLISHIIFKGVCLPGGFFKTFPASSSSSSSCGGGGGGRITSLWSCALVECAGRVCMDRFGTSPSPCPYCVILLFGGDMGSPPPPPRPPPSHQFLTSATTLLLALSSLRSSSQGVTPTTVVASSGGWEGSVYTGLYTGPYFDTASFAPPPQDRSSSLSSPGNNNQQAAAAAAAPPTNNVTAQLGSHAFLPCRVKQLGNKSVSWIRKRDSHILTVDRYTFIADERFGVLHSGDLWTLQIKYVQSRDAGVYECQVTTEPKMSLMVTLDVIVPQTKILGETDVFVKSGSSVVVKCVITDSLEQPDYIFWFHDGGRVVSVPKSNTYQVVERLSSDTTLGMLVIKAADRRDSGNYTCAPSNLQPASVLLHVLNGETQAGLHQGDGQQQKSSPNSHQQQQQSISSGGSSSPSLLRIRSYSYSCWWWLLWLSWGGLLSLLVGVVLS